MNTRRSFLRNFSAATALGFVSRWAAQAQHSDRAGTVLPRRRLGRSGEMVTAFCLGGYHLGLPDDARQAEAMVERAIELGVRFFDNARRYVGGRSEEYMGRFLTPKYRKEIFLMTKSPAKTGAEARKELDDSLKALHTDRVDLWQIHALGTPQDVDDRIRDGVLDAFLEAKAQGKTRYIGFTGHVNPKTHLHFLAWLKQRGLELDTCQMPLNVCDVSYESFQTGVLPVLLDRGYGVIAMKTMAGGSMMGQRIDTTPKDLKTEDIPNVLEKSGITPAECHQYVYSLPVSTLCTGCRTVEQIENNVAALRGFKSLSDAEKQRLADLARPFAGFNVENYKRLLS